jgi:hypothetical protein
MANMPDIWFLFTDGAEPKKVIRSWFFIHGLSFGFFGLQKTPKFFPSFGSKRSLTQCMHHGRKLSMGNPISKQSLHR